LLREEVELDNDDDDDFLVRLCSVLGHGWLSGLPFVLLLLREFALIGAFCSFVIVESGWKAVLLIETKRGFVAGAAYIIGIATWMGDTWSISKFGTMII
jgi:hypothetical protein